MRRFLVFLFILIVSVYAGLKLAHDPGMALFTYQNWSLETPLWAAAIVLLIFSYFIFLLAHFASSLGFSLYRWRNWLRWRRSHKSYDKTNFGLVELIEGEWHSAENYLLRGIQQSESPLINYLAAAKAAHEQGAYARRDAYLLKAGDLAPQAEVAIGLTQAQLQLNQGQLEQALATLNRLRSLAPKHKLVLKLLERLYIHLGDWRALLKLLPNLRKVKLINDEQEQQLMLKVYHELLSGIESRHEGVMVLQNLWDNIPRRARLEPSLIGAYVKGLMVFPEAADELEALINKALKKSWDNELAKLYCLLPTTDVMKQLAKAEGWIKYYNKQAVLYFVLGKLAMRCQLWGKARDYFATSIKLEAKPETYAEYGKLLEQLGEQTAAADCFREGLLVGYYRNYKSTTPDHLMAVLLSYAV
jgi:HemY protein